MKSIIPRIFLIASLSILITICPLIGSTVHAVSETQRSDYPLNDTITESTVYVTDNEGINVRLHMVKIDRNANVVFRVGADNYYTRNSTRASRKSFAAKSHFKWGLSRVSAHAKGYEASKDTKGTVVTAINGDFFYTRGKMKGVTYGNLILEGNRVQSSTMEPYFAMMKDGTVQIRSEKQSTSNVLEAVAGSWLVKEGKNIAPREKTRHPRQSIGLTSRGDVLIVTADGREPASLGITQSELAKVFLRQDCVSAINLDGGGSATLLTRRKGDSQLKRRSYAGDGFVRNVSSSLLVIQGDTASSEKRTGEPLLSMKDDATRLTKDSSGIYEYCIGGKKQNGFFMINGKAYLFDSNGKGVTKTVSIGDHKYTFKKGKLTGCSDRNAGNIKIGYCGGASDGRNLIFAYHIKSRILNIGLNPMAKGSGKMKSWPDSPLDLPWYSLRGKIKRVVVGKGVTNVGRNFLYLARCRAYEGSPPTKSQLTYVKLASTVHIVGKRAFYNTPKLKKLIWRSSIKKTGQQAFAYSGVNPKK